MINLKTERIAVHNCASIFSDFGWIFREQAIGDFGIDAIVETTINGKPSGKLLALQIKGGNSNFYETNSSLTFYFSETHYLYWSNYSLPVFIIIPMIIPAVSYRIIISSVRIVIDNTMTVNRSCIICMPRTIHIIRIVKVNNTYTM